MEVYSINLRVSSDHGKISAKNYSAFCYFSYSGSVKIIPLFMNEVIMLFVSLVLESFL